MSESKPHLSFWGYATNARGWGRARFEYWAHTQEWLLKFPDPDLVAVALEDLNGKLPEPFQLL